MSHGTTTDLNACLEQIRAGDPRAHEALLARAQERLRRLTRRLFNDFPRVRRFEETDDILQNALLRLLRRLEAHTPTTAAEFFALSAREIRRELLDLVDHYFGPRGAGRREVPRPAADPLAGTPSPADDPADQTRDPDRLAAWTALHEQAEKLPAAERSVFELRWYHGMTWPEAAAVLNLSEATVKRHWLAARLRLQAVLRLDGADF